MSDDLLRRAFERVDADRLRAHLEWFATVRRDTGGPGEDRAANYIAESLRAAGVPVVTHTLDAFLSYPREATLDVLEPEPCSLACVTHSFAASTGPDGLTTDLVAALPGDLTLAAGRGALVQGLATPVTILRASQAGLGALVFANDDRVIHNMIGTTIWGTPGFDQLGRLPTLPVVSVNAASGARLHGLLQSGPVRVRLRTRVDTGWYRSLLPEVRIPGRRDADLFVLLGGHYCAWDVGVTDNATGDACLIELARILWAHRGELDRSVRLCWWPGHSHGRYSGSTWYADTFFTDLAEHCIAYYNIDSPGVRGATQYVARHTCAELEHYCRTVIESVAGQADAPVHRPARAADQSFLANGVSSFSAYPFLPDGHPDKRSWTGGSANAWWWHSDEDTLDKADVDILAGDVRVGLTAAIGLTNLPVLPLSFDATAAEIDAVVRELAETVHPHVDLQPILAETARLTAALDSLAAPAKAAAADPHLAPPLNRLLLRVGRVLNPVVYSQGGRFQHDAAEWSPIMRATQRYTLAGLGRAAALPAMEGTPDYGFLAAQVQREINRVTTALREATRTIDEWVGSLPAGRHRV